jgi:hypothetical protein
MTGKQGMIGVVSKSHQKAAVDEFFELFKVHWEHYRPGRTYDVLIITDAAAAIGSSATLKILSTTEAAPEDIGNDGKVATGPDPVLMKYGEYEFPVYRGCRIFSDRGDRLVQVKESGETAGSLATRDGRHSVRIGYDLFAESEHLLTQGQTTAYAAIPTIDIHIAMLRRWILQAGVRLVEIPPCPYGYRFVTCLTHDVDFINIRDHGFGRSLLGFIARALIPRYLRDTRSKIAWSRLVKNWKALLVLPGVYLGLAKDTWFDIDRYLEIEKGLGSTYFFIPFKNDAGHADTGRSPKLRAAHYDIAEQRDLVNELIDQGCEIGLHGIDAWRDTTKGSRELQVIRAMIGEDRVGVRMHWLFFSAESSKVLDEAGYDYDSTIGFNEAIGFRSGTTQAYRLPGTRDLIELPLNLMDTTLFYGGRMALSESDALMQCERLVSDFRTHGGVLTINWHTRSLNPERNWDDFYTELLSLLRMNNVWFATAKQAVNWYRKRRALRIDDVSVSDDNSVRVTLSSTYNENSTPPVIIRLHHLNGQQDNGPPEKPYRDVPWNGEPMVMLGN